MCTFTGFLVAFCEFVVFFRVCSWNSKVFQLASRLFQLNFLDFQGFSVGLCDFRRFFSLLVGPLQAFQLVFVILHGILNGQQVVSVGILGLLQVFKFTFRTVVGFLVGFWISLRFFHLASRLFQLVFVTFACKAL